MNKTLLLCFLLTNVFISSNGQNTCKTIVGTIGNGNYEQLVLASYSPTTGNANWHEVLSFAWTCNAIGYPTCNYRTLLKYNLSGIPSNAVITSAKLKLFAETSGQDNGNQGQPMYGSANTSLLQQVTSTWNIASTGWNNIPNVDAGTQKTLAQSISANQNYEVDIADFVQSWVSNPTSNFGMLLRLQTENAYNSMVFFGGTASVTEEHRPTLEICYTIPAPSCTSTVLKGTIGSGNYEQLVLASYSPTTGNANWHEVLSFAWTCNAIGYSTCNYRTLLKYNLSGIPSNAVITSAKLKLFAETSGQDNGNQGAPMYGSANTSLLQQVTTAWNIASTGWNNIPNVNAATQKTLAQSVSPNQNYELDIADFVQSWVSDPTSNFGMLLRLQTENSYNSMVFFGGTASVAEEHRPTLEICYVVTLPVVLKDFAGSIKEGSAALSWKTVNEYNNIQKIELCRSTDGINFDEITSFQAKNSKEESDYKYTDDQIPASAHKVFYRLNIVDNLGRKKSSNILSFGISERQIKISLSPIPTNTYLNIEYNSLTAPKRLTELRIVDITGRTAFKNSYAIQKGNGRLFLSDLKLSTGVYFLSIEIDGELQTRKFTIQK